MNIDFCVCLYCVGFCALPTIFLLISTKQRSHYFIAVYHKTATEALLDTPFSYTFSINFNTNFNYWEMKKNSYLHREFACNQLFVILIIWCNQIKLNLFTVLFCFVLFIIRFVFVLHLLIENSVVANFLRAHFTIDEIVKSPRYYNIMWNVSSNC